MKSYILLIASIFCVAEASFRSAKEHQQSFEAAKKHPALGAALIVVAEAEGGKFRITNGVYIAPGKAISHAHEDRPGKTWVISPFAGCAELIYLSCWTRTSAKNSTLTDFSLDMQETLKKYANSCRKVKLISFPSERRLIDSKKNSAPIRNAGDALAVKTKIFESGNIFFAH